MSSTIAVASSTSDRDDFFRPRNVATSFQEGSVYGSPKSSFDIIQDGWVSSFDEDGNFLEVSFEASPDNESVLLMGGSASEAELNQHFFPRMPINTSALSSIAPRISTLKNPISTLKNPIPLFSKKSNEENENVDKEKESVSVSSGKKRRRKKKLAKRMSKLASKVVPKRFSQAAPKSQQEDGVETNASPSRGKESAKKLKKKILKRISKKVPLLRMRKIGRVSSAEGAFPTVPRKYRVEVSSVQCAEGNASPRDFASDDEIGVDASESSQHDHVVPATSTDETSETSSGDSDEEAFTPNMVEATVLYHDQRLPVSWGGKGSSTKKEKKSIAPGLGESIDESSDNTNRMRIQRQLEIFSDADTFSCDLEELMRSLDHGKDNRRRSRSACVRTDSTEFADIKISCSNSTRTVAMGRDDDSMSATSTQEEEWISPMSTTAKTSSQTPIKTIAIPKDDKAYESPSKSPTKPIYLDTENPPQSPVGRTPPFSNKNGSGNKKQFNYRARRKQVMTPTRLQIDQAPSSPIGDLLKPRRSRSLKRTIKKVLRNNPVATTTVALSAVLLFLRSFA